MLVLYFALVGIWGVFLGVRRAAFNAGFRGALFMAGLAIRAITTGGSL